MEIAIEKIVVGEIQTNCYVVSCRKTGHGFVIDPGDEYEKIRAFTAEMAVAPSFIVNTHGHADHMKEDEKFGLPVYIHSLDEPCLRDPERNLSGFLGAPVTAEVETVLIEHGGKFRSGEAVFEVIHTPGHTPGSICLKCGKIVFTGDTLFCEGYGRTDLPGGSDSELMDSIMSRLMSLPDDTSIYPGHGPASTIGAEKEFLKGMPGYPKFI